MEKRGYPPSMREIGEAVGLTSSSSVAHQLKTLEEKGYLKRDPKRPRALEVFLPEVMAARRSIGSMDSADEGPRPHRRRRRDARRRRTSRWSAGSPPAARSWPRSESRTSSRCPSSSSATASCSCPARPPNEGVHDTTTPPIAAAQARIVALLDRRVEGVEVGMEDRHEHMFAYAGTSVPAALGASAER